MAYYKKKGYKKSYNRRGYYHYYPSDTPSDPDIGKPYYQTLKNPPVKPKYSDVGLSEKTFQKYSNHPSKAARHRKYDFGCLPLVIVWVLIGVAFYYLGENDVLNRRTLFFLCLGVGAAATALFWYLTDLKVNVDSYDRFLLKQQNYEALLEKYNEALRQKAEDERIVKEKHDAYLAFINGPAGMAYLSEQAEQLKAFDAFQIRTEVEWRRMSPREFEFAVGDVYAKYGYRVQVTKESSDGGVDVILTKGSKTTYVQCKHYAPTTLVAAHEIREFHGVCMSDLASGIFVHTSSLTPDATAFANKPEVKKNLKIVPLNQLIKLDEKRGGNLLDINTKAESSLDFLQEVINNRYYVDCRFFWLYKKLFDSEESARSFIRELTPWDDMQYAIAVDTPQGLETKVFYIILATYGAIHQLSKHRVILV